jgi:hypothetical protein
MTFRSMAEKKKDRFQVNGLTTCEVIGRRTFFLYNGLDNVVDVVMDVFRDSDALVDDRALLGGVRLLESASQLAVADNMEKKDNAPAYRRTGVLGFRTRRCLQACWRAFR